MIFWPFFSQEIGLHNFCHPDFLSNAPLFKKGPEPQILTPTSKTIFLGVVQIKVVAPGKLVICPVDKNRGFKAKNDFGHFWYFGPNVGLSCPFDVMPNQQNNVNKVPRWFSYRWVPKRLPPPQKIRIFGPKTAKFGQNMHFWLFWAKHWLFWPI